MAVVHLLPIEKFPLTRCGVNIEEKLNADWVADDEEGYELKVTCANCRKLMAGVGMGKTYSNQEEKAENVVLSSIQQDILNLEDRSNRLDAFRSRIQSMIMDLRVMAGDCRSEEEEKDFQYSVEWLEAADSRISMADYNIRSYIKEKRKGESTHDTATDEE